jgi:hypothetical protein
MKSKENQPKEALVCWLKAADKAALGSLMGMWGKKQGLNAGVDQQQKIH